MSLVPPLTTAEAAKLIDVQPGTLRQMRVRGTGPRFVKAGSRVRYDREDLVTWVGESASGSWPRPVSSSSRLW